MKIERINDNQIRCTLTREDLVSRHLKLSELAYGTDKAKALFKELMEQASYQVGFEAEDIPLMIEAVPLSSESLLLVVTKVENPEELDTRFSRFSHSDEDMEDLDNTVTSSLPDFNQISADDVLSAFKALFEKSKTDTEIDKKTNSNLPENINITKMFVFENLTDVIRLSKVTSDFYNGKNSLYKNPDNNLLYLVFSKSDNTLENFNKVCNILSEYGNQTNFVIGSDEYMHEHYDIIIEDNAIETLSLLS